MNNFKEFVFRYLIQKYLIEVKNELEAAGIKPGSDDVSIVDSEGLSDPIQYCYGQVSRETKVVYHAMCNSPTDNKVAKKLLANYQNDEFPFSPQDIPVLLLPLGSNNEELFEALLEKTAISSDSYIGQNAQRLVNSVLQRGWIKSFQLLCEKIPQTIEEHPEVDPETGRYLTTPGGGQGQGQGELVMKKVEVPIPNANQLATAIKMGNLPAFRIIMEYESVNVLPVHIQLAAQEKQLDILKEFFELNQDSIIVAEPIILQLQWKEGIMLMRECRDEDYRDSQGHPFDKHIVANMLLLDVDPEVITDYDTGFIFQFNKEESEKLVAGMAINGSNGTLTYFLERCATINYQEGLLQSVSETTYSTLIEYFGRDGIPEDDKLTFLHKVAGVSSDEFFDKALADLTQRPPQEVIVELINAAAHEDNYWVAVSIIEQFFKEGELGDIASEINTENSPRLKTFVESFG